jgi:hypothetical protein
MGISERMADIGRSLPAPFREKKDGLFEVEFTVGERKTFLHRKTLKYIAKLRADEKKRELRFFETLRESEFGMTSGEEDMTLGVGFKVETYKTTGKEKEGDIEEKSRLFGKDYSYSFDFSNVREKLRSVSKAAGFKFSVCLDEKSV